MKRIILVGLLLTLSFSLHAETKSSLWTPVESQQALVLEREHIEQVEQLKRLQQSLADISPTQLASAQFIQFDADAVMAATVSETVTATGVTRRVVRILGEDVVFMQMGDVTMAVLQANGKRQHLVSYGSFGVIYDADELPVLISDDDMVEPEGHEHHARVHADSVATDNETVATLDLYVVYTQPVVTLYGQSGALARIELLNDVTNQIYADSNILMRTNILRATLVDWDPENKIRSEAALTALRTGDEFAAVRMDVAEHGADFTVMYRPFVQGDTVCGIAYVLRNWENPAWNFSHTSINCGDEVTAHELGHNLGLRHSRRQDDEGFSYPYAVGYGVDNRFVTVMAYTSSFNTNNRVFKFSSPDLQCTSDLPCGILHTAANGADAARATNNVRLDAAASRTRRTVNGNLLYLRSQGLGRITANVSDIRCGANAQCGFYRSAQTTVTLTATALPNSQFAGWIGACEGTQQTCTVTVGELASVTALFNRNQPYLPISPYEALDIDAKNLMIQTGNYEDFLPRRNVNWQPVNDTYQVGSSSLLGIPDGSGNAVLRVYFGNGSGTFRFWYKIDGDGSSVPMTVTPYSSQINNMFTPREPLPTERLERIDDDQVYSTSIIADGQWRQYTMNIPLYNIPAGSTLIALIEYSADSASFESSNTVYLDGFEYIPNQVRQIGLRAFVSGQGYLTSSLASLNCRGHCGVYGESGDRVTITAVPAADSEFRGWAGACAGQAAECTVTLSEHADVIAYFADANGVLKTDLAAALDNSNLAISMLGGPAWRVDHAESVRGGSSVRVTLPNRLHELDQMRRSSMMTLVDGPGQFTFAARTDLSDASTLGSQLQVYVNGSLALTLAGRQGWQDHTLALGAGANEIEWRFVDRSASSSVPAEDRVWIDNVRYTGSASAPLPKRNLDIDVRGVGRVTGDSGIFCQERCNNGYLGDRRVTLTASEISSGWHFTGWSGACSGAQPSCTVDIGNASQVVALFSLDMDNANFSVTFDLGEYGSRTGGGALMQTVAYGQAAEAPTISVTEPWHFAAWNRDFTTITADTVIQAVYQNKENAFTVQIETGAGGRTLLQATQYIQPGDQLQVQLIPDEGFVPQRTVQGNCPTGYWSERLHYVSGEINQSCVLRFEFNRVNRRKGKAWLWYLLGRDASSESQP